MNKDQIFQDYANYLVKDVSDGDLRHLVALFMLEAAINMGADVNDDVIERSIYYIRKDYSFVPVNYIASAFVRGSLGKIGDGKGRLVPKTILQWLTDSSVEYNRMLNTEREKQKLNDVSIAMDLHKCPVGSAIAKKIDWYKNGTLKIKDWDKVPLNELAEKIRDGIHVYPQMFGIVYKS